MFIQPNTDVRLLSNVPLDNTYKDTIFFNSKEEQTAHFLTYGSRVFGGLTYQRVNSNKIRVQAPADALYYYNYLLFRNTAYGDRVFYAFITAINYINDATTEIEYEIDVMQTWMFDYTLMPSYVIRETSATDNAGDNIASESVDTGAFKCTSMVGSDHFARYAAVIFKAEGE